MSYTNSTTHYGLPLPVGTDRSTWTDTNTAFEAVDTALYDAVEESTAASTAAASAVQAAQTATQTAQAASTAAANAGTVAGNAATAAAAAQSTADAAQTAADAASVPWKVIYTYTSDATLTYGQVFYRIASNTTFDAKHFYMLRIANDIYTLVANNAPDSIFLNRSHSNANTFYAHSSILSNIAGDSGGYTYNASSGAVSSFTNSVPPAGQLFTLYAISNE